MGGTHQFICLYILWYIQTFILWSYTHLLSTNCVPTHTYWAPTVCQDCSGCSNSEQFLHSGTRDWMKVSSYYAAAWNSGFPGGSDSKESTCKAGDADSIPGLGRFPQRREWQLTPVFFLILKKEFVYGCTGSLPLSLVAASRGCSVWCMAYHYGGFSCAEHRLKLCSLSTCPAACRIFPTQDWIHVLCFSRQILNHWTTRGVPCSGILAWRIPWTEEPGGLQSMRL